MFNLATMNSAMTMKLSPHLKKTKTNYTQELSDNKEDNNQQKKGKRLRTQGTEDH